MALDRAGFDVHLPPWNPKLAKGAGKAVQRLLERGEKECDLHLRVSPRQWRQRGDESASGAAPR